MTYFGHGLLFAWKIDEERCVRADLSGKRHDVVH